MYVYFKRVILTQSLKFMYITHIWNLSILNIKFRSNIHLPTFKIKDINAKLNEESWVKMFNSSPGHNEPSDDRSVYNLPPLEEASSCGKWWRWLEGKWQLHIFWEGNKCSPCLPPTSVPKSPLTQSATGVSGEKESPKQLPPSFTGPWSLTPQRPGHKCHHR